MKEDISNYIVKKEIKRKPSFLTFIISLVPGAGQMYLGLMGKGFVIMASFFLVAFLTGWLNLVILSFILPVIWCYSVFDTSNIKNDDYGNDIDLGKFLGSGFTFNLSKSVGYILIGLGVLTLVQGQVIPLLERYFGWEIVRILQTSLVSMVLIAGGIYIIKKNRSREDDENEEN